MGRLEFVHDDDTFHIGTHQNLLALLWCDAPTVSQLRSFERVARGVFRTHAGTACLWNVILRGTPRFSDEVRAELTRLMRGTQFLPLANVHLILAPGLAGAATRAFMNTAVLVGRSPIPARFFGNPKDAATWFAPYSAKTPHALAREELLALHEELLARAG